ncbi:hypothetical protein ERO13_D02G180001v2 [Gossypium hirsutum]|uniref:Uncharacterized protein n=3 Tax=Gossypium TaxID=3633 RepID=A0A5D2VZ13_GOSMU|nr:hypothetical protein ERO13_D02G180001v2 [Gossypium hirsutum]TYI94555.1 hypothetical protein E1A91_D02G212300v1 [Gossypium mustelinum]
MGKEVNARGKNTKMRMVAARQASAQYFLTIFLHSFNFPPKKITFLFSLLPRSFEPDCLFPTMKKSALFSASLAATISAFTSNFPFTSEKETENENSTIKKSTLTEKFAPRFDGLKFIETLITAHR